MKDETGRILARLRKVLAACVELPVGERIAAYNAATQALAAIISDVSCDPALAPRLVPIGDIEANDYNPNRVASPELALLRQSIEADGITMAIVTIYDSARRKWTVVDGFHRRVIAEELHRSHIPTTVINRPIGDRMAATVRHNRARGKHQVDLMATLVKKLLELGWDDPAIAKHLGMTDEELLRLKQIGGAAKLLAGTEYSQSWGPKASS